MTKIIIGLIIVYIGWKLIKYFGTMKIIAQNMRRGHYDERIETIPDFFINRPQLVMLIGYISPVLLLFGIGLTIYGIFR